MELHFASVVIKTLALVFFIVILGVTIVEEDSDTTQ